MAPLTDKVPKPILPVLNCPLLWWSLAQMSGAVERICINTHYLHSAFEPLKAITRELGIPFSIALETELTGPFGGVLACFGSLAPTHDVLVCAGDGYYNADFANLLDTHCANGADLTIGITPVLDGSRYGVLTIGADNRVLQMREKPPYSGPTTDASCGVYVVSPKVIARFADCRPPLDWVDVVQVLVADDYDVRAARINTWHDAGTPKDLLALNLAMLTDEMLPMVACRSKTFSPSVWIQGEASVSPDTQFEEAVLLGCGAIVESGASLYNAIIGAGACIRSGAKIANAVVMPGAHVPMQTFVSNIVWS
ncbi:MAG: NDP-sugar synthase [Rhizobiales bacterium]|nr:NDP-sugar synthase [Hyphomicrobiales bacterium]